MIPMVAHAAKIAITLDPSLLKRLDYFVKHKIFKSRSQAIQLAVQETVERIEHTSLAQACEKLDPDFERQMADEGLTKDDETWSTY